MNGDAALLFHITFNMHKQYSIIVKLHGANDKLPLILHINNTAAENMAIPRSQGIGNHGIYLVIPEYST